MSRKEGLSLFLKSLGLKLTSLTKLHKIILAFLLLGILIALIAGGQLLSSQLSDDIKSADMAVQGGANIPAVLQVSSSSSSSSSRSSQTFQSGTFQTEFEFNAIAPHWHEQLVEDGDRAVEIRVSGDGRSWSNWLVVEAGGPLRDDDPRKERTFPETPLFITGRFFQYRVHLQKNLTTQTSPLITDMKVNYIDSRPSLLKRVVEKVGQVFTQVLAAEQGPTIVSRAGWGSPDPHGEKYRGTSKYWQPTYKPVSQVFLHHTVTASQQSDPKAVIRAIWDFHTNTRGWGDIGYNYLIDSEGRIYEGRFAGDNVVAGHVFEYNRGSLGVAVLGCFQSGPTCNEINGGVTKAPTSKVINGLVNLLSWKTTNFEIDPKAAHSFCNFEGKKCLSLNTIAAHRDAGNTACNGDLFYNQMSTIRDQVDNKNTASPWSYSATQKSYGVAELGGNTTSTTVTLTFKNTGTATWSNSTNRLLLKTANPNNRISKFKSEEWLDDTTPAVLNEASVPPGENGTFSFKLERPSGTRGYFFEGFRLVSEGNTSLKNIFSLAVNATFAHPDGTLIKASRDNAVFWTEDGKRRHVMNPAVFRSHGFSGHRVKTATATDNNLPFGPSLNFREGAVVKGDSNHSIYAIDYEGSTIRKRAFAGPSVFKGLGYGSGDIINTSTARLPAANGPLIDNTSVHPDGTLIKASDDNAVFWTEDGQRRHVMNPAVFKSRGFSGHRIKTATATDNNLPFGSSLNFREGAVVKGDTAAIYVIDYATGVIRKRGIPNLQVFFALGYTSEDIIRTSDARLPELNGPTIR